MTQQDGDASGDQDASHHLTAKQAAGSWDNDELVHHDKPGEARPSIGDEQHKSHRFSIMHLHRKEKGEAKPEDWGFPGELTKEYVGVYTKFRDEVEKRGGEFKKTVYSFGEEEGEAFCLCRWLRARKFVYDDVIKMVEEATECRKEAREKEFYPDPSVALGVDPSVYISLYPQLYSGNAKNGCPIFISKPGILNVDGMECITTLDGILKFHWHVMMHDYTNRLQENKKNNPEFTNYACVCVLDLEGLTASQLSSRALAIIKTQTEVDSLCFPETMSKMVVINAPRFFAMTWRLIKGWIDPRTAGKVDLISSRKEWEKRLKELVDEDQLPSDYGGKSEDTNTTMMKVAPGNMSRQITHLLHVRAHAHHVVKVEANEELEVIVYTRGTTGAKFSLVDKDNKSKKFVDEVVVVHDGKANDEHEPPTIKVITSSNISGPAHVKVKADSKSGRFSGSEAYLLVLNFHKKG